MYPEFNFDLGLQAIAAVVTVSLAVKLGDAYRKLSFEIKIK